jgi:hypothetical protein
MVVATSLEPPVNHHVLHGLFRLAGTALLCALPAASAMSATQVLVVAGRGGEAQFDTRFGQWSQKVATASATVTGDAKQVIRLAGPDAKLKAVQDALQSAAETLKAGDQFLLVLMGHGSHDGSEYRYMLWGNDITGTDLGALLDRIPNTVQQLVINGTSASGAIVEKWTRPHRVVITATKSAGERNAPKFAGFWADALGSDEADRDRSLQVRRRHRHRACAHQRHRSGPVRGGAAGRCGPVCQRYAADCTAQRAGRHRKPAVGAARAKDAMDAGRVLQSHRTGARGSGKAR